MMMTKTLCLLGTLAACGNDIAAPRGDDPPAPDATAVDPFPPPPTPGVQITTGPLAVAAGEERTECVFLDLPSDAELPVVKLAQHNAGTAHHFILFRSAGANEPHVGPCPAGLFALDPPIYPGTRDQGAFEMPPGVAITLAKHQSLIIQIHLLNASDHAITEELRMNLYGGAPGATYTKAGVVGGSDFNFRIPPGTEHTETQRCYVPNGLRLFALTSHSHARTRSFDVTAGPMPIYHNESWSEPEVGHYEPAIEMGAFSWLEFSCRWFNETDHTITYGETAEDEMCMMFGYYYPATLDLTPCIGL